MSHKLVFFLALLCLVCAACGTTAPTGKILFEDPRGTVSLQTISDRSIQANHPINLDPALLAQILQGIEIQDQEHGLQKMLEGPPSSIPVFSDDQIRFLAPLLAEGLRTAAPDQSVAYRVQVTRPGSAFASSTTETTAGSLYAYGRQLYVTLSQYRCDPIGANWTVNKTGALRPPPPDYTCLRDRTLLFTPSAAQRVDSFDPPTGEKSTDRFLAIDYELLQQASPAVATTEQTAPQPGTGASDASAQAAQAAQAAEALAQREKDLAQREAEIQALKDIVNKNVSQVETLRKELESVQKQLDSQPTRQDSQKGKTTPPSKQQQTAP